jgi:hypothetical protein
MAMQLKVIAGTEKDRGRTFNLPEQGSLHLGRGPDSDSRFTDVRVSGSHCRVYAESGRLTITDNGSTNGTFINERQLAPDELRDLFPGDVIRLGENTRMEVAGDDIAVMKTIAGNAGMLAQEIAAAAARLPPAPPPFRPSARPSSVSPRAQPAEATVEITCNCGQELVAREKYAGTRVRCPNCRNMLQLPGRPALVQPVVENESFEVPIPEKPGDKLWTRMLTAVAGILLFATVGICLATLFAGSEKSTDNSRKAPVEQAQRSQIP